MLNLFDILQNQGGMGVQGVSQQFGLSPDQTRRAMEALLPAFTIGLQRNAATDPTGVAQLFGLAGAGMNALQAGRSPPAPVADQLVGQFFGSPLVSQAVIQQAAAVSGVGSQVLRQMLPVVAGMIVAGIVHVIMNQNAGAPVAPPANPAPAPYRYPGDTFWTDMVSAYFSAGAASPQPEKAATPARQGVERARPALPAATPGKDAAASEAPFSMLQQMFQSGIDAGEQNAKAMQGIFDAFWSPASGGPKATTDR